MKWTEEDIEILTENYLEYGPQWCADVLDRTYGSVRHKAPKLGLSRKEAFEKEQEMLKKLNKYLENTGVLSNGSTETFRMPPQELDILW